MKVIFLSLIVLGFETATYAACLPRQKEVDYYTLSKFNRCTKAELLAGQSKMKKVLQKTKKSKSYKGRTAEKALAELQLYGINHEIAMRSKKASRI
jgi:propanediol dehydratase small subunit